MPKIPSIPDHAVIFKGIEQGIMILLDKTFDFERIIKKTIQKIKANKKFLSENTLFISGADGPLDPDEMGMARKMIRDKTKMEILPLNSMNNAESTVQDPLMAPVTVLRNSLRAGQEIKCGGDLILFGDAHPGSSITAGGSVFIFGKAHGKIYAGNPANTSAIISSNLFNPIQVSIGGIILDHSEDESQELEYVFVQLVDKKIQTTSSKQINNE